MINHIQTIEKSQIIEPQDFQGIEWNNNNQRKELQKSRLKTIQPKRAHTDPIHIFPQKQYNYEHFTFLRFHKNYNVKANHYQLLNNLTIHQHTLIFPYYDELNYYNLFTCTQKSIELSQQFLAVGIDSFNQLIIIAGLRGNVVIINQQNGQINYHQLTEQDSIINQATFYEENKFIQSDNDGYFKLIDISNMQKPIYSHHFLHAVNHSDIQNNLAAICLDSKTVYLSDINSNNIINKLNGHQDFNFCVKFNPVNQNQLATASQDTTVLVWDLRKLQNPIAQIVGKQESFYNIKFYNNLLICQEASDYLHILDTETYQQHQIIDFFGQTIGSCILDDILYFGVSINQYQGIFEFTKHNKLIYDF